MSKTAKQRFGEKYISVQETFKEIRDIFEKFENKEIPQAELSHVIEDAINDIKRAQFILKNLNIKDIYGEYDKDFIDKIRTNIDFMKDSFEHFYENLSSVSLYDDIIDTVKTHISDMHLNPSEYKKWAQNETQLAIKFTEMLVKHVYIFKNQIKRMAIGTLSNKEFKKIYHANRGKMIPIATFESFQNYKEH
jgi:hypothetical protein